MKNLHRADSLYREHYMANKKIGSNFRPSLIYSGVLRKKASWSDDVHSHAFCEVLFIKSGEGLVEIANKSYEIKAGDIVIYNPKISHKEISSEENSFETYFFACKNLNLTELPKNFLIEPHKSPVIHVDNYYDIFNFLISELVKECSLKDNFYSDIADSLLKTILVYILKITSYVEKDFIKPNDSITKAKLFIDNNFHKEMTLDDICDSLFISKFYLVHLFKSYEGISPKQYIIYKRIEKAKEYLRNTDLSVIEISEKLGYSDVSYFSRAFKSATKKSPSTYRTKL